MKPVNEIGDLAKEAVFKYLADCQVGNNVSEDNCALIKLIAMAGAFLIAANGELEGKRIFNMCAARISAFDFVPDQIRGKLPQ